LKTKDASEFHDHNDDYQGFINTDSQYLGPVSGDGGYDDGDD
jgi:hypothetical protein